MARSPSPPASVKLNEEQIRQGIARLQKRVADVAQFDVQLISQSGHPGLYALEKSIEATLAAIFGAETVEYNRYSSAASLDYVQMIYTGESTPPDTVRRIVRDRIATAKAILEQAVKDMAEDLEHSHRPSVDKAARHQKPQKIFLVHGHDEAALHAVARFLERLNLDVIVLKEQPNQGRTIIEKFEDCASEVGFAVVLMTPDDVGGAGSAETHAERARQNVVFELGYFAGKLGRGRVCLLRRGNVDIPSDLLGVVYTTLDGHDGWKGAVAKELKAAGINFDANLIW